MIQQNKQYKVILNVNMANRLIGAGFNVVEVKPSSRLQGKAAFIFELNPEFDAAMARFSKESREFHKNN